MANAQRVLELLRARGLTVAVAESFTGGKIQDSLTDVAGASDVFVGGIVAYHNRLKRRFLGVPDLVLRRKGSVSREAAIRMARGVRRRLGADVGVATTGIAGPTGATPVKPLGLTFVAVARGGKAWAERRVFRGNRRRVKARATQLALDLLARVLRRKR